MTRLVVRNARIVLDDEVLLGSLVAEAGVITAIDPGASAAADALDLEGDWLLPGLVEIHTDNLERHLRPRPQVAWDELPALLAHDSEIAGAGITTVLDAISVGEADGHGGLRSQSWEPLLACLDECRAKDLLRADHWLHVRCELPAPNALERFEPFRGHARLRLLSLMDHTPGQRQWEDVEHARIYYTRSKGWSEEQFRAQVERGIALQAKYARPQRERFVDFCRAQGIALASHDDTTPAHVEEAHAEGACISEFPTTRLAAEAAHRLGLRNVMGGPNLMRGGSHSGNVAAAELARAGLLDILSSDYVPASLLGAAFVLHHDLGFTMPQAVARVARLPAQAVGLADRGRIALGLRADLVRVRALTFGARKPRPVVRALWREGRRFA